MAKVNLVSSTNTSLTCNVTELDTNYSQQPRTVYWYLDGEWQGNASLPNQAYSGGEYTFRGLSPGTRYYCHCVISNGEWEVDLGAYFYTDSPKPIKWSWTDSNGSATAAQTRAAYNSITGGGSVNNFSYLVWNDLCDKAKEIQDYVGSGWDSTYTSYQGTRMSASNRTLTATRFNSLRRNINTGWGAVRTGDVVNGSYFTQMAAQINSWIDYL